MIEVRPVTDQNAAEYERYVQGHAAGLLYYRLAYRDLIAEHLGCEHSYHVAVDGQQIQGVLPVMWREDGGCRVYNSLPFFGSNGGVLASTAEAEQSLWDAWNGLASADGTLASTAVENPLQQPRQLPPHTLLDERINQMTPLPAAGRGDRSAVEQALLAKFASSARRNVRKAAGIVTRIESGADGLDGRLEALAEIHDANMRVIGGLAKPAELFAAIPRHFTPEAEFDVYLAFVDRQPAAALLVFTVGAIVEYFTPAVVAEHRSSQPLAAILHQAMTDAAVRGCRDWNWGGTWISQEGVYRFKRKWGPVERRYRYFINVRDDSVLDCQPDELLARFPGFYIVPFSALRSEGHAQ